MTLSAQSELGSDAGKLSTVTIITIASLSIALFLWCYIYPMIKQSSRSDGHPAAHTLWAARDAYRAPATGPEPLPRLVALTALALAHPLVLDLVRIVLPHDAAPVRVGHGLGGDRRARERERSGTRSREPHDAQEGR